MALDVAHKIDATKTGVEGAAYINPNGLRIVTIPLQKVLPQNTIEPLNDVALSGKYVDRFDDPQYYTA